MTFEDVRARFPVCERIAYLNAGTFGPLSRGTAAALGEAQARALADGRSGGWEQMGALREQVRGDVASLLSVAPEQVAVTASTSDGCSIVMNGLRLGPEDEVVTTDVEHVGLVAALGASGARIRVAGLRGRAAADALDAILAEVTPRTRLLALSHVSWLTGQVIDVHALKERTGLPILVDGAQSAGAIEVNAQGLDYYTVSCQKWLCAPDPTGALVVADPETLAVTTPTYLGIASFEPDGRFVSKPTAARFDTVSHSLPTLAGLAHAVREAPPWRFDHARAVAERCRRRLLEAGLELVTEAGQATLVTFRAPGGDAPASAARAAEQGVVVRSLPGTEWVRASCGYWTSDDDVERLVAAVRP